LSLHNQEAVTALAASTTLTNLTHLGLAWTSAGDELITQLLAPPSTLAKKLQSIDLRRANVTVSTLEVLSKASPYLTELKLAWNQELGPTGTAFVAAHMPNLTKLDLSWCQIGDEGYAALAASATLTNLRELNLEDNRADTASIVALVNSPVMANMTRLQLDRTHRGPEVLTAMAQSPSMSKLEHLSLNGNEIGDKGVIALAQSTTMQNLTWLDLAETHIRPKGVRVLCTSPIVSKLVHLSLNFNRYLGNSISAALAAPSSTLYNLLELNLWSVGMDDEGFLQLLSTPNLDQLNLLGAAGDNKINRSTKAAFLARFDHYI
jgi:Ran GTPase-activating protein (RanGAP) involved in mRNA processing and transport